MTTGDVLSAERVGFRYGRSSDWILDDVSLTVRAGELVSIAGENGSGKSTLLSVLSGRRRPVTGRVVRPVPLGYCPQTPALYPMLTVLEHFRLYGRICEIGGQETEAHATEMLGVLDFERFRHTRAHALSGGTAAKLNLSLSLTGRPRLVVLDEPYAAFDVASGSVR